MRAEDELDTLYGVPPEEFTALRKELVNAAKERGDTDAAKVISAARRPTVAAWVVNELIRADPTAKVRIAELNAQLRAAHAAMDGGRIRELSTAQRKLVSQLARTGFAAAGMPNASAAVREDVTGTLQAAIADPEVAAQLGRLAKAQEWSGFGDFGAPTQVTTPRRSSAPAPEPEPAPEPKVDRRAAEKRRRALAAAERAHGEATAEVADRTTALATARRRYEEVLRTLSAAEQTVAAAEQRLQEANDDLAQADSALAELRGESPT